MLVKISKESNCELTIQYELPRFKLISEIEKKKIEN